MQDIKLIKGFTLIEVLVSTLLIGLAALLSLSIISTLNKNQATTRDNVKYLWVTKSIKSAFSEYLNSVDATNFIPNENILCGNNAGSLIAKQNLIQRICDAEIFLGNTKNTVGLTLFQSAAKNGTYFYWGRIRVINKQASFTSPQASDIYFERLFINQK